MFFIGLSVAMPARQAIYSLGIFQFIHHTTVSPFHLKYTKGRNTIILNDIATTLQFLYSLYLTEYYSTVTDLARLRG